MRDLEFKKFPIFATVLAVLVVVLSVVAITTSLPGVYTDSLITGLVLLTASVLFVAGLTTGKIILLRVISIISSIGVIIASFVLTVTQYGLFNTTLFTLALLMLICSVLSYIYFLTSGKNNRIKNMYLVSIIVLVALALAYTLVYILQNLDAYNRGDEIAIFYPNYLILFGYSCFILIPLAIRLSLSKKENVQEEKPEENNNNEENF